MLLIQMLLSAPLPEVAARSYLLAEEVCTSTYAFGSGSISRAGAAGQVVAASWHQGSG